MKLRKRKRAMYLRHRQRMMTELAFSRCYSKAAAIAGFICADEDGDLVDADTIRR